ncbi:hypothetical protein [Albimonas pacifica]|uniref:Uncharacterized protein n=1 Tax=Albimonas pacifica TaxID=1114924 RepID=A0A1I3JL25_9RHOB|nr:hypothetical protein [Albimonas pacifica]SFI60575.1 hypothetical protein SAMN05216258_10840 [Albimonas pacifica]
MCIGGSVPKPIAAPIVPTTTSTEASVGSAYARRMQQMRAGAAANILTSPTGIPAGRPSNRQMGGA